MALWPWKSKDDGQAPAAPTPGEFGLPADAAAAILAVPHRAAIVRAARERLSDIAPAEKAQMVDRIVARFALTVVHLGASEEYHHAGAWGLLDHSLDVALRSVQSASDARFSSAGADPGLEYELLPRWRYAAFVFGLLHDVGKVVQLRVATVDGDVWNPFVEPLAAFLLREELWPPDEQVAAVEWTPRRGLDIHERHNALFVGRVLTPEAAAYLGPILPLALEQGAAPARALAALVSAADQDSVRAERRGRLLDVDTGPGRPAFVRHDASVADLFPQALQIALERGALAANHADGDAYVGERYVALAYPGAVLKVMDLLRDRWKDEDARVRHLKVDQTGVKQFMRELAMKGFLFRDRESGTWKLKATVTSAGTETKTFLTLVRREILETEAFRPFAGRIAFYSILDLAPVAVDDFGVADAPSAIPMRVPVAAPVPPAATLVGHGDPATPSSAPPTSSLQLDYIDPRELEAKVRDLVLSRKFPVNVHLGVCFVTREITFLIWPRAIALVGESMGCPINPFENRKPWMVALSGVPSVLRDDKGAVIASVKFRPESEKICRVVRFDTEMLFGDPNACDKLGVWVEPILPAPADARIVAHGGSQA